VRSFATELEKLGNDCCVAVPFNKESISHLGPVTFQTREFTEALQTGFGFSDGRGPDVIHAWTPREIVRKFCRQVQEQFPCRLFVHMEDNEWHILSCALELSLDEIKALDPVELQARIGGRYTHPLYGSEFKTNANGITIIIDRLGELLPPVNAMLELWPSADEDVFTPRAKNQIDRRILGIASNSTVIVYTGNVHRANAHEVRSLYLAVAMLNREGFPATLVRAGREYYPFLGPDEQWARRHSVELGLVSHRNISGVLASADILVQPGRADEFNDFRFPSKLPEFFSVGRPVILPHSNIGKHVVHGRHAYVLFDTHAVGIADAIRQVATDPELYDRLSEGALEFFRERFSWAKSAKKLSDFYLEHAK